MSAVDFLPFLDRLADRSGDAILPFFRTAMGADDKSAGGAFDPVTEADRGAEVVLRRMIEAQFPEHGIVGEEFGSVRADSEYVWVLDPIDGTKSFISGLPVWGTLIGLMHHGNPCYGLMHQPFTGEKFSGDNEASYFRARGAEGAGRRLRVRTCDDLATATLMTTSPRLFRPHERTAFERVEERVRLSRYGGDCYAYCMLAAGHVDLVIEAGLQPYDIVALIPIIRGAGGIITTWDGGDAAGGGAIIAAGDARVHAAAMELLK